MVNAMSTDQNIVYFSDPEKGHGEAAGSSPRGPLQELQDQFTVQVTDLFAAMLDNTDDALFALADKAENNRIQSMYFDSMREVRLKRGEMEARFRAEVLDRFRALRRPSPAVTPADAPDPADWSSEELSLVGHDDLEESLAVDGMVGKARSRNAPALAHLRARVAHLLPGTALDEDSNPIDPRCLCGAFRRAAQALDLEVRAKLVVYKLFDKSVMEALGDLYTQLNRMLINAGVLPHIKIKVPGARPAPPLPRTQGGTSAVPADGGAGVAAGTGGEVFGTLQGLLAEQRGTSAAGTGAGTVLGGAPAVYASGDVLHALNLLQTGHQLPLPESGARGMGPADLRVALGGALAQLPGVGTGKALGRTDEDIIDIVSMLFDFILDDAALPDRVKALLARLQIPMLKVAMLDRSFFSSRQHPARQLLNELAQGAAGAETAEDHDALYRHSAAAVDRILQEFEDDVGIFSEVLDAYRSAVGAVAPAVAAEGEGEAPPADPVEAARARARAAVMARLEGREPPSLVVAMLRDAWSEVLTEVALDETAGPAAWDRAVEVIDRVLSSIEPKVTYEERKRLIESIPALLRELRQGLARISVPTRQLSAYFQALQECHIECIKEPQSGAVAPSAIVAAEGVEPPPLRGTDPGSQAGALPAAQTPPVPEALAEPDPLAEAEAPGETGERPEAVEEIVLCGAPGPAAADDLDAGDEHVRRLRAVALGTWFEFTAADGTRSRAKLSARLERVGKLIFVNRAGFKIAEKTVQGLVVEMRRGTAEIVDDGLLFDKALEAVISNLRNTRA